MKTCSHRRDFIKRVATLAGAVLLTPIVSNTVVGFAPSPKEYQNGKPIPRINPAFRIQRLEDGTLELFTFKNSGTKISYSYNGFEASLLLLIVKNSPMEANLNQLASQYSLNGFACKLRVDAAIDEFRNKGLIYFGDLMIVKKTEVTYEQNLPDNH
jgi:hypothetical protein